MASLNKTFLMGNLTRNVELRYTDSQTAIGTFGIAVNRKYSVNGQDKEEVCFVDITVYGKQAENCDRYLQKGSSVFIEGRLQLDQWEDRESGAKRSKMRVVAEKVQFMPKPQQEENPQAQQAPQQNYGQNPNYGQPQGQYQEQTQGHSYPASDVPPPMNFTDSDYEDDIPF